MEPCGEIYLQIIQQKWRKGEGEKVETAQIIVAKRARRGGQREKQGLSQVVQVPSKSETSTQKANRVSPLSCLGRLI